MYCRRCGDYYELPPLGHDTYQGESIFCTRSDGADGEAMLAQRDLEEADETFALDSAVTSLYAPDE